MAGQRQMRIQQNSSMAELSQLQHRSDDELLRETRNKAAAFAILGSRAAERYDNVSARKYFQQAIAAAKPMERPQIKKMADASLALAERRPDDLRAAVQKLGQEAPSNRQLFLLRIAGLLAPPAGSSGVAKLRAAGLILLLIMALIAAGTGVIALLSWVAPGGLGTASLISLGFLTAVAVLIGLILFGRRRQRRAMAQRQEAQANVQAPTNRQSRRQK